MITGETREAIRGAWAGLSACSEGAPAPPPVGPLASGGATPSGRAHLLGTASLHRLSPPLPGGELLVDPRQGPGDREGRAQWGRHPVLSPRGASAVAVLRVPLRTGGPDHHHPCALGRLDPALWRCTPDRGRAGSAHVSSPLLEFVGESLRVRQRRQRHTPQPRGKGAMNRDGGWNTPAPVCRDLSRGLRVPHPVENAACVLHGPQPRPRGVTVHPTEVIPRQPSPRLKRWLPGRGSHGSVGEAQPFARGEQRAPCSMLNGSPVRLTKTDACVY